MSPREQLVEEFAAWLRAQRWNGGARVFSAPYGILTGMERGNRARCVTFGIARRADIHLSVYSPTFLVLRDSRFGQQKFTDIEQVKRELAHLYKFTEVKR